MDTSDPEIKFDEHGFCNQCTSAIEKLDVGWRPGEEGKKLL